MGRDGSGARSRSSCGFQFTRPAWGATARPTRRPRTARFNSRAPHGARQADAGGGAVPSGFQFTRPAWGATDLSGGGFAYDGVSIHAPRMGRDFLVFVARRWCFRFNSRAPHGARRGVGVVSLANRFQFTRPAWGATLDLADLADLTRFNSRAPHGARLNQRPPVGIVRRFNSRAPHGARPLSRAWGGAVSRVSIHAPRMGRDQTNGR